MLFKNGQDIEVNDTMLTTFKDVHARLAYWQNELERCDDYSCVGMEGMIDHGLGRIMMGITDTILGLANTLKTNVFKFAKDVKRTELKEFVESHTTRVAAIENLTFDRVMNLIVVVPSGMGVSYRVAANNMSTSYDKLQAVALSNTANLSFTNIFKSFAKGDNKAKDQLSILLRILQSTMKDSSPHVSASDKNFDVAGRGGPVQFKRVYATMEEFKLVREILLEDEVYLESGVYVQKNVTLMGEALDGIIQLVEKNGDTVDKGFVEQLSQAASLMAQLMDSYSRTALRHMALEHNHILNINNIYQAVVNPSK